MAVSSSTALPRDVSEREMAEDGELESLRFHARPPSKRCQHPDWFILQGQKAGDSNATELPAHRLAGEPGTLAGSPSVPNRGFEPRTSWV